MYANQNVYHNTQLWHVRDWGIISFTLALYVQHEDEQAGHDIGLW